MYVAVGKELDHSEHAHAVPPVPGASQARAALQTQQVASRAIENGQIRVGADVHDADRGLNEAGRPAHRDAVVQICRCRVVGEEKIGRNAWDRRSAARWRVVEVVKLGDGVEGPWAGHAHPVGADAPAFKRGRSTIVDVQLC